MSDSLKKYPTRKCLARIKHRDKREEVLSKREWEEYQEKLLEKELRKEQKLQEYLKEKGETY